ELAASWLRLLEPSELLAEVRRDLDVVRAAGSGVGDGAGSRPGDGGGRGATAVGEADIDPSRSSLRAVFESSWSLLGERERESLRRLASSGAAAPGSPPRPS